MKYYETPTDGDECIHALHPKSSIIETDLSVKRQPERSHSRIRWLLCDIGIVFLFGAGCFRYFYTPDANAAFRDNMLAQLGDDEVELSWTKQHLIELEDRMQQIREDEADTKILLKEEQVRELEVEQRLAHAEEENEILRMELHEIIKEKPAPIMPSLRGNGGDEFKFLLDDIVELNTPHSNKAAILPHKVEAREMRNGATFYKLVQVGDGYVKESLIPENDIHLYEPYATGIEANCNMGNFDVQNLYLCTVTGYTPSAERGLKILVGTYDVEVHNYLTYENIQMSLPVWMITRNATENESD